MTEKFSTGTLPPPAALLQMMTGYWISQAIYVAAKLGIADLLAGGQRTIQDLAAASNANVPSLRRLLRALASMGIFTEAQPDTYALTPMAAFLQTGTPDSMRALALMYNSEQFRAWGDLLHSVQTGESAFEHQFGSGPFEYFAQHPEANGVFNEAMTGWTNQLVTAAVDAYDFSAFRTVVDVGGGYGALLTAILKRDPNTLGILFDQPHVVAGAEEQLSTGGVGNRLTTVGGDFFMAVPANGDAYVLSQIIHDWDDESSIAILKQVRRVMPENGKMLVIELVIPPGEEPNLGKWLDLHMLVMSTGARERTSAEYNTLFRAAGFRLARIIPTTAGPSVMEGIPV